MTDQPSPAGDPTRRLPHDADPGATQRIDPVDLQATQQIDAVPADADLAERTVIAPDPAPAVVEETVVVPEEPVVARTIQPAPPPPPSVVETVAEPRRTPWWPWLLGALVAALAIGYAIWAASPKDPQPTTTATQTVVTAPSTTAATTATAAPSTSAAVTPTPSATVTTAAPVATQTTTTSAPATTTTTTAPSTAPAAPTTTVATVTQTATVAPTVTVPALPLTTRAGQGLDLPQDVLGNVQGSGAVSPVSATYPYAAPGLTDPTQTFNVATTWGEAAQMAKLTGEKAYDKYTCGIAQGDVAAVCVGKTADGLITITQSLRFGASDADKQAALTRVQQFTAELAKKLA